MTAPASSASLTRRHWLWRAIGLAALPLAAAETRKALAQDAQPQVVQLVAQRFHYTPAEFEVKAGVPVVLEIRSLDFMHGFNMPDMNVRADLPPGQVTRVQLPASAAGIYEFVCDNFCGTSHEEMHGRMVVKA